jgi:hypothetical protein
LSNTFVQLKNDIENIRNELVIKAPVLQQKTTIYHSSAIQEETIAPDFMKKRLESAIVKESSRYLPEICLFV